MLTELRFADVSGDIWKLLLWRFHCKVFSMEHFKRKKPKTKQNTMTVEYVTAEAAIFVGCASIRATVCTMYADKSVTVQHDASYLTFGRQRVLHM